MRLARIRVNGGTPVAAVERDGALYALADDLSALLGGQTPAPSADPVSDAVRLAPVAPGKVVAIGLNYLDHIRESGLEPPEQPLVFAKFPSSVDRARTSAIRLPLELTQRVDWEVELAVVIGRRARGVARRGCARPRLRLHGRQRRLGARPAVRGRPVGARQEPRHVLPARPGASSRPTRSRTRRPCTSSAASTARWSRTPTPI